MTQEEIISGNKLIAEFMAIRNSDGTLYRNKAGGYQAGTLHFSGLPINYCVPPIDYASQQWDSSWDWIMPVVEKIEGLNWSTEINFIPSLGHLFSFISAGARLGEPKRYPIKIDAAYSAVVEFIKWYNLNK